MNWLGDPSDIPSCSEVPMVTAVQIKSAVLTLLVHTRSGLCLLAGSAKQCQKLPLTLLFL